MTRYIVQMSGGVGSWGAARRLVDEHGPQDVTLLVANTNSEAEDWLSFLEACQADLGCDLVMLDNDGRDIWDVFLAERFIGNTRVDICSRVLKREPLRTWIEANCDLADTVIALGFDWTEEHRLYRARPRWAPWEVIAPLTEAPYREKGAILADIEARGMTVPAAYRLGMPHNNCLKYGCVKGGKAYWRHLLQVLPESYARAEAKEEEARELLGNVTILRDRSGGVNTPLSLRRFREYNEGSQSLFDAIPDPDEDDWGGCSCMDGGVDIPGEVIQ